jgi:hypothetical protein
VPGTGHRQPVSGGSSLRKLVIFILIVVILAGLVAGYLFVTTPKRGAGMTYPLTPKELALLSYVPAYADSFALIPTATATYARLRENPITRTPVETWAGKQSLPSPWMIGGADLAVWKVGNATSYAVRLDPVRATLVRIYLMMMGDEESSSSFRINAASEQPLAGEELARIITLAAGLPAGDVLAVQRERRGGAFPPIGRPAVSSLRIATDVLDVVSHSEAPREEVANGPATPPQATFARNALLTAWFASPPRQIDDLGRLFGARIASLVTAGGAVVLYEVESNKLLPRPKGVFVVPADDERRQAIQSIEGLAPQEVRQALGFRVEHQEQGRNLLVAFDGTSLPLYLKDTFDLPAFPANRWALRLDAQRLVPVLEQLDGNPGLRIAAPRLYRSAKDLRHWTAALREARSIEAADSVNGPIEELRVRIASKQ